MNLRQLIKQLWRDVIQSVKGTEYDFTKGNLYRAIFLLSVPMVLEMIMESIFSVVDIFFVSKLGADAVTAVGLTESMMTLVYALAVGFSAGTAAIVSRRIGEKNPEKASRASAQSILLVVLVSLFFAVPGIIYARDLLSLMGASDSVIEIGWQYTAIMLGTNIIIMLLFIINAIFRSAGDAAISMRILWTANIINIVLDPCLIFGIGPFPELGVKGAAIATSIGRGVAVLYQFYLIFNGNKRIKLAFSDFKIHLKTIRKIVVLSLGGIGQHLIATTSWIGLVRIVAEFGSDVMAGYTIAIRIIIFTLLPSIGMSNAAATLTGQNLGAKQADRAEKSVWLTGGINLILLGIASVFFIIKSEFFVSLFIDDPVVIKNGAVCLKIISFGFIFYALGMVMVNALNGAGDTFTPTLINLFCFWLIEIPLAYLLALHFNFGERGVYFAIIISETLMTIAGLIIFKLGRWKTKIV